MTDPTKLRIYQRREGLRFVELVVAGQPLQRDIDTFIEALKLLRDGLPETYTPETGCASCPRTTACGGAGD